MTKRFILSEKPEDALAAIEWAKEEQARIEKSEELTKKWKEILTSIIIANLQKAKAQQKCQRTLLIAGLKFVNLILSEKSWK